MPKVQQEVGWLLELNSEPLGSALVADAAIGDTVLYVNDAVDFEETGGTLQLNGTLIGYASCDPDTDTITLNGPLVEAAEADDEVAVWDVENASPAAELSALVEVLGLADDDPIPASLALGLGSTLQRGPRDGRGETVVLEQYGPSWRIVDVLGKEHVLQLDDSELGVKPKAPTNVDLTSAVYVAAGRTQGRLTVGWDPVTEDTNDDDLADGILDGYEVQFQQGAGVDAGVWIAGGHVAAGTETLTTQPFTVGEEWAVRVRAVTAAGVTSDWSAVDTVIVSADTTPPNKPSTPTATSRLGVIQVTWDGKDYLGGAMPADFDYTEIHASTTSGFTPTPGDLTTLVGRLYGAGTYPFKANYDTTYYVKLIAVDTSGNASTASSQASSVVKPLVDVSNFPDDAMQVLYARTGHFLRADADWFAANKIEADWVELGLMTALIAQGDLIETSLAANTGVKISSSGIEGYNSSTHTRRFFLNASTGKLENTEIESSTVTGSTVQTSTGNSGVRLTSAGVLVSYTALGSEGVKIQSGLLTVNTSALFNGVVTMASSASVSGGLDVFSSLDVQSGGLSVTGGISVASGGITVTSGATNLGNANLTGALGMGGNAINSVSAINNAGGTINMDATIKPDECFLTDLPVTSGGEAVYMGGSGRLFAHTSPSRIEWKDDVEVLDVDPDALAALVPISWTYRDDVPFEVDDLEQRFYGIPFDDAARLGLRDLVDVDRKGTDITRPERLSLLLLAAWSKDHHDLVGLKQQVAELVTEGA